MREKVIYPAPGKPGPEIVLVAAEMKPCGEIVFNVERYADTTYEFGGQLTFLRKPHNAKRRHRATLSPGMVDRAIVVNGDKVCNFLVVPGMPIHAQQWSTTKSVDELKYEITMAIQAELDRVLNLAQVQMHKINHHLVAQAT